MESVSLRHAISATHQSFVKRRKGDHGISFPLRRFHSRTGHFRFPLIHSKQFNYQDFQDYAKPARLLHATEVKVCTDTSAEKVFTSFRNDVSQSLYRVKIDTSSFSASSLTDLNAGVLLCLIDENGDSILQRIPASSVRQHSIDSDNDLLHFQRGSVDEFTFEGPKLGRVEAIWIGLESGQWRFGRVSLIVVCLSQSSPKEKGGEDLQYVSVKYEFQAEDVLLGEGSDISVLELRPCLVTELSEVDPSTLFSRGLLESTSLESQQISNEESMREYADLKFSLLLYDALLIFIGTLTASFLVGEDAAFSFLTGGIGGFLYLLLLQRSVDGLPVPESSSQNTGGSDQMFGGFKGPITSIALAIGFALFTVKYSAGDFPMVFTPKNLIFGMLGFLACKVAVVLAAFKPVEKGLKINK